MFGARAALAAISFASQNLRPAPPRLAARDLDAGPLCVLNDADKLRSSLRRLMWGKVGLVRTSDSLAAATAQLSRWERVAARPFSTRRDLEVKNMIQVARCITTAALWRENSVGAHYRADFPSAKRSGWRQHSRLEREDLLTGSERTSIPRSQAGSRRPKGLSE